MFHASDDSPLFRDQESRNTIRLYEAKCYWQFDHRFSTFTENDYQDVDDALKADPNYQISIRYHIEHDDIPQKFRQRLGSWYLSFRKISNATNARTLVASITPKSGLLNSGSNIYIKSAPDAACLLASMNSFALDYVARQKMGGPNMTIGILLQTPSILPAVYENQCQWSGDGQPLRESILRRVLELVYTAWDLEPFAQEIGYTGPPFQWNEERRFMLRCELDAAFFHLYGINRDDLEYIMNTFPIVKRKDEQAYGEYRTKRIIIEIYDEMTGAMQTGGAYLTRLDPPPSDPSVAHPSEKQPV